MWAESRYMGLRSNYYACMEGAVYDITEWANCQVFFTLLFSPYSYQSNHCLNVSQYRWDTSGIYRLTRIEFSIELFQVKVYQEAMVLAVINLVNVSCLLLLLLIPLFLLNTCNRTACSLFNGALIIVSTFSFQLLHFYW